MLREKQFLSNQMMQQSYNACSKTDGSLHRYSMNKTCHINMEWMVKEACYKYYYGKVYQIGIYIMTHGNL